MRPPEIEQYLLFEAVVGLLRAAAQERPLLIFLDDLHWADKATLALLRHVISSGEQLPILVVCTFRDSEVRSDGGARRGARRAASRARRRTHAPGRTRRRGCGGAPPVAQRPRAQEAEVALARHLASETSGNPFFLGELLRHHAESGALRLERTGSWLARERTRPPVPDSVREVIGHRVHRLGATAVELLQTAAVIGVEFDLVLLAAVLGREPDELLDPLDVARRARLVREEEEIPGRYRFEHALVNHALVLELGATRRARLHERIAELLDDWPDTHPGVLAYHWTEAGAHGRAIRESRLAGQHALDALAPDEAARWFAHALELHRRHGAPDRGCECDLLTELGEAQRRGADRTYRVTLLEASRLARELRDGERLGAAALANTRGFESASGSVDEARVSELRAALELSADADPLRRARLLALLALELTFVASIEERRALSDRPWDSPARTRRPLPRSCGRDTRCSGRRSSWTSTARTRPSSGASPPSSTIRWSRSARRATPR